MRKRKDLAKDGAETRKFPVVYFEHIQLIGNSVDVLFDLFKMIFYSLKATNGK